MRAHAFSRRVPLSMALLSLALLAFSPAEVRPQPGDDFFGYANGAWLKAAVIPAGRDRWSVRDEINEVTRRQIAAILDDARTSRPGSLARKVGDFRSALLNQSAIDEKGLAPL